jgi:hypothetical protein
MLSESAGALELLCAALALVSAWEPVFVPAVASPER